MTKRHYIAIAAILRKQFEETRQRFMDGYLCDPEHLRVKDTAESLADYFETENPLFDRLRFLTACGMVDA